MLNYSDRCLKYEIISNSNLWDENPSITESINSNSNEKIIYNNNSFFKNEPNIYENYEDLFINKVKLF